MGWDIKFNDRWQRGDRLSARWANAMARALNRAECLDGNGRLFIHADGGLKLELDDRLAAEALPPEPLRITIADDKAHYSVLAARVWERAKAPAAAVAAVVEAAISATRWLYVPITISTSGTVTAGAIAESAAEPAYWTRDGSNQTLIKYCFGKITVTAGAAELTWNTTGDIYLLAQAGQTVAVSAANNPVYLAAAFKDTGTSRTSDLKIYLDELQDDAPGQKLRFYLSKTDFTNTDWDQKVAVNADNNPNYLSPLFNDVGNKSGVDVLVYRDALQGNAPDQKIRLYCRALDITSISQTFLDDNTQLIENIISNYLGTALLELGGITSCTAVLGKEDDTVGWVELEAFECPT